MGLISNPNSNTSNGGGDETTTTASASQTAPGDTGGDDGHTPKK